MANARKKRCPACGRVYVRPSGEAGSCPFCGAVSGRSHPVAQPVGGVTGKKVGAKQRKRMALPLEQHPIGELELSPRAHNCLMRSGVNTVGDLVSRTESEIRATRHLRENHVEEVRARLLEYGLRWREDDAAPEPPAVPAPTPGTVIEPEPRSASHRQRKRLASLKVGSVVKGTVRKVTDFGAFVDVGGAEGLVHVTQLSWGRVRHPSDVVRPGQRIRVKVLAVNPDRWDSLALSYKATVPGPWSVADRKYHAGSVVEGRVVHFASFGAFVELEPGLDGLIPVTRRTRGRMMGVRVGDIVRVKVTDINTRDRRISLVLHDT